MERILKVSGIRCAMCVKTIEQALSRLEGVEEISVNLATGTVRVKYEPDKTNLQEISEVIASSGYKVEKQERTVNIRIGGMSCAMCAKTIENSLRRLEGVSDAVVNLADSSARIVIDESVRIEDLKKAIEESGYRYLGMKDQGMKDEQNSVELDLMKKKLIVGGSASAILLFLVYGKLADVFPQSVYIQFVIATLALVYAASDMFSSAVRNLRNKTLNMDVMYSMGVGSAYSASIISLVGFLPKDFIFFETSILLLTFLLLGKMLEAKAKSKTGEAIRKLTALQAKKAVVLRDEKEVEVDVEEVILGDVLVVKPGGKIPVDGIVMAGESYVDESMVTGEPIPNLKVPGDQVIGGTISKGYLKVKATKVGKDTFLSQIIRMVEEAVNSKPPIQRLADGIVAYFIPIVLAVAISSFVYWYFIASAPLLFAFTTLVAVLVVACPCAFGLATPTALTVGMGKGAELGILIKNGDALEIARKVTTVVFDKTGTLTEGKPRVNEIISLNGKGDELEVLKFAAIAERRSEHPIAEAIVEKAKEMGIAVGEPEKVEIVAGKGVVALVERNEIVVGNKELIGELVGETGIVMQELQRLESEAKTTVVVAKNGEIIGIIGVSDSIKEGAKKAVERLHRMGKKVVMMTGDNRGTAEAIARKLGIDNTLSDVLPNQKAEEVKKLQETEVVAFVGDGINDAPALAQADLGIAIGSGTDIAIESGDIVLVRNDLMDVVAAIQLSQKTLSKIKQNIFWALIYNSMLIPLAAGILFPFFGIVFMPEWAGLAMAMSSVSVVMNSLLMKKYIPPERRVRLGLREDK